MNQRLIAIVPAAGIGARAATPQGLPKQYRSLGGQPMLRRAVSALLAEPRIEQVRVAVAAGDTWVAQALHGLPRTVWRACGGPARADTVYAALGDAPVPDDTWVLVHDAARPGLSAAALARLVDACLAQGRGGLLALPVADTVKQAGGAGAPAGWPQVAATLPRDALWLAQTPQMFRKGVLRAALAQGAGDPRITDEASAVELAGQAPLLVHGERANDKLTWPQDFDWFEAWLRGQALQDRSMP